MREFAKRYGYRLLLSILAFRERFDLALSLGEIAVALLAFLRLAYSLLYGGEAEWAEYFETFLLLLLTFSILARFFVRRRQKSLGYLSDPLLEKNKIKLGLTGVDTLFSALRKLKASSSFEGAIVTPADADSVYDAIAQASASVFSPRTYHQPDAEWRRMEKLYLKEWHAQFSAAIWHAPPDNGDRDPACGYFSVIVPITRDSWRKVSKGHLSTMLVSVDTSVFGPARGERNKRTEAPLYLLAYCVVYAAGTARNDAPPNQLHLVYTGVEHLAFLLNTLGHASPQNVNVICESSGDIFDATLFALGFDAVRPDRDDPPAGFLSWLSSSFRGLVHGSDIRVVKSPAGFKLFQLDGPSTGNKRRDSSRSAFWQLLRDMIEQQPPRTGATPAD
jgi:hypothetical protein